jgi:hypothetical protein
MKLNTLLIVLMLGFGINAFAESDNKFKKSKGESTLNQEFQLKREFEVDSRSRKIAILNNAVNCMNVALNNTTIQNCIKEEKNDLDVLRAWEKEHKALFRIR